VALAAKFLTVDEVRAMEGLAPSPELAAEREAGRQMAERIATPSGAGQLEDATQRDDDEEDADAASEPEG
jgi:hypothetical protein